MLKRGTYARESGGGCLLYHSDSCLWNDASYGLKLYLDGTSKSSLYAWRRVTGDEAEEVWKWSRLGAGENIVYDDRDES